MLLILKKKKIYKGKNKVTTKFWDNIVTKVNLQTIIYIHKLGCPECFGGKNRKNCKKSKAIFQKGQKKFFLGQI
jgi:hypothetical protein